jgi:excisionase family DNA binding protein
VICDKLHITTTTLRRWEALGIIPYVPLGPDRRYLPAAVEKALRERRFGPPLDLDLALDVLRERVPPELICDWLNVDRKTLKRRMTEGRIPYYKLGQTYRFAPDEVIFSLGIESIDVVDLSEVVPGGSQ